MNMYENLKNNILKALQEHYTLFRMFQKVYLFGSALDTTIYPNDIDLLLVYEEYSDTILSELSLISNVLERITKLPIDLTVLSSEEEKETAFLDRIKHHCIRIK